jgi:predicted RecB family nuclease
MGEKEIKKCARKGIFTLTQFAQTFRPRRKGRRADRRSHHRYHALQAMAVRDKRVYVFGTPVLPASPVTIYLDLEGNPEEGSTYLIGMLVDEAGAEKRYSFWADDKSQEEEIFKQFLSVLQPYENFRVLAYGGYEKAFLKRMRKRVKAKEQVDRVSNAIVNVLSTVFAHVYFPTYSNGLKEIGSYLGARWSDNLASGIESIAWRIRWEATAPALHRRCRCRRGRREDGRRTSGAGRCLP